MKFYSHGKLLLTGEYFVLDGALALAAPTRKGQTLKVYQEKSTSSILSWESLDYLGRCWFKGDFELASGKFIQGNDGAIGERLEQILKIARQMRPELWQDESPVRYQVTTELEFPSNWGLGSSSTLISNIALWLELDPYELLAQTFGGSGYDIACARANSPVFYQLLDSKPQVQRVDFKPNFADNLFFLFLEQKQNSRTGIARYRKLGKPNPTQIQQISELSVRASNASTLTEFQEILLKHETMVGDVVKMQTVHQRLFSDFKGVIKSLGAWGGDFVLVASEQKRPALEAYFFQRGFPMLIPYAEMFLDLEP